MGHAMDGMLPSPSSSHVEILARPQRQWFRRLGLGLNYEGGVLMNGMSALLKEASE